MLTYQNGVHAIVPKTGPHPSALLRVIYAALLTYVAFKIVLLVVLGINTQYLMDEYLTADSVKLLDDALYRSTWPGRTILYLFYYKAAHWLGADSVEIMRLARIQSLALSLVSLGLLYGIARQIGRDRLESLLVVGFALSISSFMERAFMVRPEPLALLIAMLALWTAVRWPDRMAAVLVTGVLAGVAFLTTQKAAYFDLALGLALVAEGLLRGSLTRAVASGAVLLSGWLVALAVYIGVFTALGADPTAVIKDVFFGSATSNAVAGHTVYEGLRGFVFQTLERNISVYLVCLIGLVGAIVTIRQRSAAERIVLFFTIVVAVLVYIVHPAPWPYNFIMAIPFLALWGPIVLAPFRQASVPIGLVAWCIVLALLVPSIGRNVRYLQHDNELQNETVRTAESLLAPTDRYFDGVRMVVARRQAIPLWFQHSAVLRILDDAARGDFSIIESILGEHPKVWILSYRTDAIWRVLEPFLMRSYVRVAPNVLLAGVALDGAGETIFENRWGGTYRLQTTNGTASDAAFLVDGTTARGTIILPPGRHVIRAAPADGPLYLLPVDANAVAPVTSDTPQWLLFDHAYTF